MKRTIDIKKIKKLLKEQGKSQKELAMSISLAESNLSSALNNKGRKLPMSCLIDMAIFFNINPMDIITSK